MSRVRNRTAELESYRKPHAMAARFERAPFVPVGVLQDAMRRRNAEQSLTASIMGDPAPGQSALDKREVRS